MKYTICLLTVGLVSLCATSQSASAAVVEVTWTGQTGFPGNDNLGLFGPPGLIPTGTSYTATYQYDSTIGFEDNVVNGSQSVTGGSFFAPPTPSPLVSASITINGTTFSLENGDYDSQFFRQTGQGSSAISTLAQREIAGNPQPFGGELFQRVSRLGNFYSNPLTAPGEFDLGVDDNPTGEFLFFNRDASGNFDGPNTQIPLIPSHVSITLPVPEPASLLLVLAGSALLGSGMRRRSERCLTA